MHVATAIWDLPRGSSRKACEQGRVLHLVLLVVMVMMVMMVMKMLMVMMMTTAALLKTVS